MQEDPSQLTDEELDQRLAETEEEAQEPEQTPEETPEETPEQQEEQQVEETPETPEGGEEPEEPQRPISRREQLRVNDLLNKYGKPSDKPLQKPRTQDKHPGMDYQNELEADPELVQKLEQDRQLVSDAAYQEGLNHAVVREWSRDLKFEAPVVSQEFPFLNPKDTENFNPAAANAMNQKYLNMVGYDPGDPAKGIPESVRHPDISYREFVESEMEFAEEIANQKIASTQKNIAQQAATTGLRPDGSAAKKLNLNKAPEQMSDEELDAVIAQGLSQK